MVYENPSDFELRVLLTEARTIAVVGASSRPEHPSHGVMQKLLFDGYHVVPISQRERAVLGRKAYGSLLFVPFYIDIVVVFARPDEIATIADQAAVIGATALWIEQAFSHLDATERARKAGVAVVIDEPIVGAHARLAITRTPQYRAAL